MSHAVNWFQIQGPNGSELVTFYKTIFGWKMQGAPGNANDMMMVSAEKDGIPGGVGTSHNHQPSVAVYISVGDIDAVFGKIERAGGKMAMPKMDLPGGMGSVAGFTDPAGNWIGLWMPSKGAPAPKAPRRGAAKKKAAGGAKKAAKKSAPKKAAKKSAAKKRR